MNSTLMKAIARTHVLLYRLTGGAIGGSLAGKPMLLLTTNGRKTGKLRTTPLQFLEDGENIVVIASNGGSARHPGWWFNLEGNSEAEVQLRRTRRRVRAETAGAQERTRRWALAVEAESGYENYQKSTDRQIPVVILKPEA
jgi:F420H(2)-dependent quinone reductase